MERGFKMYLNVPCHMTKMATTPIYGKILKKSSSPEPVNDSNVTWCVTSGTLFCHGLYKSQTLVDIDLFYNKEKISHICFSIEKSVKSGFFRTFCSM